MIVSQLPKDFAFYKKVASRQYYGAAVRLPSLPALESLLGSGSHFSADAALTGILLCILYILYLYSLTHSHTTRSYSVHNAQLYDIVRYKYKCNYCTLFLACLFQTLPGDRRVGGMRIVSNRVVTVLCAFCFSLWLLFVCLFFLRVAVIFNFCDCLCRNRRL